MFDDTMTFQNLFETYNALFVPVIVAHFIFLAGYLIKRIRKG